MDREEFVFEEPGERDEQFAVSYELLCLLRWMVDHDASRLKKMVSRAVARGLKEKIVKIRCHNDDDAYQCAHDDMVEFFCALEAMLAETIEEQSAQRVCERHSLPALEHIDTSVCDERLVQTSLEKASPAMTNESREARQDLLLREILKEWKPKKKMAEH